MSWLAYTDHALRGIKEWCVFRCQLAMAWIVGRPLQLQHASLGQFMKQCMPAASVLAGLMRDAPLVAPTPAQQLSPRDHICRIGLINNDAAASCSHHQVLEARATAAHDGSRLDKSHTSWLHFAECCKNANVRAWKPMVCTRAGRFKDHMQEGERMVPIVKNPPAMSVWNACRHVHELRQHMHASWQGC